MPRCSSAQRSVASAWREKRKQVVSRVRGVCDDVTCPFLHSGVVQILKTGQVHTNDPFCCPNSPLQSSYIWFAGWPKPYSYRRAQNRLNDSRVKLCHVRLWQVELFQLTKKVHSLLGLFHNGVDVSVPLQVLRDGGSQEPEWLHCIHRVVHDSEWGEWMHSASELILPGHRLATRIPTSALCTAFSSLFYAKVLSPVFFWAFSESALMQMCWCLFSCTHDTLYIHFAFALISKETC